MKVIITKTQIDNIAMKFLNDSYGLEEYRVDKFPNIVFYVRDGKVYIEHEIVKNELYISRRLMHNTRRNLENIFGLGMGDGRRLFNMFIDQYADTGMNDIYFSEVLPANMESL
jgi:hypothetical protein